jgi:multicomponent Na+:H+ antiporter subunit D
MLLALPIALPFAVAILCFFLRDQPAQQRAASLCGALGLLGVAGFIAERVLTEGPVAEQMSGWPAPFGITLAVDAFAAAMLVATALTGLAAVAFGFAEVDPRAERLGHHTLLHMLLGGVSGAFATGDLFNLYVWFEVLLISSFGLLVIQGGRLQLDGAVRYVGLNLLATVAFLTGVGLLYGATGALNMADLRRAVAPLDGDPKLTVTAALLLFAFGAKAAMFPVFFWLPASYHAPSFTVSAVFAALLTKVGVYSMIRVFTLIYGLDTPGLSTALLWGGAATMLVGALGALAQTVLRRVLAFQVVASIGVMTAALGVGTEAALAAAVFYAAQDMLAKMALFAGGWLGARAAGSEDLPEGGGVWVAAPLVATLFLLPALSLAGAPPFSGFWAKALVVDAALVAGHGWIAALTLATGLLGFYAVGRVWAELYWKDPPAGTPALARASGPPPAAALLACGALAAAITLIGVFPAPFVGLARLAAEGLLDPSAYVAAVLEPRAEALR